ncbi:hypothetical protein BG844_02445 [Couchioplanes caeruleus subsp. caeruleus]|uniref:Uncharacterized protein n=1 Tax=Couchioplanes caeruleus subsp. caeruleus TaxID=56427 RepID=A0A1K0FSG3_9ACTN|nr:hypothetical protein BG844_02445 [Couchioplanes caeruleus subsp. caeruleus]
MWAGAASRRHLRACVVEGCVFAAQGVEQLRYAVVADGGAVTAQAVSEGVAADRASVAGQFVAGGAGGGQQRDEVRGEVDTVIPVELLAVVLVAVLVIVLVTVVVLDASARANQTRSDPLPETLRRTRALRTHRPTHRHASAVSIA